MYAISQTFPRLAKAAVAGALALAMSGAAFAQTAPSVRVRGTITGLDGEMLLVHSREGRDLSIKLPADGRVESVVRASLADVKQGTFIGTAAVPGPNGSLKAIEVVVFPEALRGTGEGHSPWDLLPESTMTNATVADTVDSVDGRTITLTYKNEKKTVTVPPEAPIVTIGPADRSDLKPGETVFMTVQQQPDGTLQAGRVRVSKNGVKPPM